MELITGARTADYMWLNLQVKFAYNFIFIIVVCMLETYERRDYLNLLTLWRLTTYIYVIPHS